MRRTDDTMVIVGAGMAGGNAAVALREEGFGGRVLLLGDEPVPPYGRPPLSKTYLKGEEDLSGWLVRPADWYGAHDVELRAGPGVAGIDTAARRVALVSGESFAYSALLLATGARNRRLAVPGADLPGVHQLRTVAECDAIRRAAGPGRHAVVVGMGFIGSEVAASLRALGLRVTVIFPGRVPLERVVGPEVGEALATIHRERGVELLAGDEAVAFEGGDALEAVVTRRAGRLPCDLAVIGVGVVPEVRLADGAGVPTDNGILVDERCRTSVPDVYAAGDVANHRHPLFGRLRVEHYNNAEKQGRYVARSMLGTTTPYDYVHSFWSDQYDHTIEYVGHASRWDRFVMRGSLEERRLVGFYLAGGVLQAAVGLDRGGDPELEPDSELAACAALIGQRATPSPDALADDRVELQSLGQGVSRGAG
jgi:3-phenylpropionate/trans-cinnamate dioxygenase ferredoxin reductase component